MPVIDADSHLYEPRTTWADYIDPVRREDALVIEEDELGYPWLTWRGQRLHLAELHRPGHVGDLGDVRQRRERGEPCPFRYDEALPAAYTDPDARVRWLDEQGLDASVVFPNHGLLWEGQLAGDLPALTANLGAYNRFACEVAEQARGRLYPVAHLTLRDRDWAVGQVERLGDAGIKLAMLAPSPVDGVPLSDPRHDPVWAACVEHDVAPVFHVGAYRPPLHPDWYAADPDPVNRLFDTVMLWVAPAAALADLTLYGTLARFPDLRVGVVELTAHWVPQFLVMLDGGAGFHAALTGWRPVELDAAPSDYVRRQVRVGALAYEQPAALIDQAGEDLFMFGSDWPHAEGIARPLEDYRAANPGIAGRAGERLYGGNAAWLLGLE